MAFGNNLDGAIDHFDGGLVVNRVRRHPHPGGPSFGVDHGKVRKYLEIHVRKYRKIDQSQRFIAAGGWLLVFLMPAEVSRI
jgi:hypothetical protein